MKNKMERTNDISAKIHAKIFIPLYCTLDCSLVDQLETGLHDTINDGLRWRNEARGLWLGPSMAEALGEKS